MRILTLPSLALALLLAGCGPQGAPVDDGATASSGADAAEPESNPLIEYASYSQFDFFSENDEFEAGTPAAQITKLDVGRTTVGVIIHATGQAPAQNAYAARLVPQNGGKPVDGVLGFTLTAILPEANAAAGGSSRIEAVRTVPFPHLKGVDSVRVTADGNVRTVPLP